MIIAYYEKTGIIIDVDNIEFINDVEYTRYQKNKTMVESMGIPYTDDYKLRFNIGDDYLIMRITHCEETNEQKCRDLISSNKKFHSWL